jgi:hypothetical protein
MIPLSSRRRSMAGTTSISLLVLALILTASGCVRKDSAGPAQSATIHVVAAKGAHLRLDLAAIEIPPSALVSDAMVTIVRLGIAREPGAGPAYAFHLDPPQTPRVPLVLHLPAPGTKPADAKNVYVAYRDANGTWTSIPGVVEAGGTVRAETRHLSDWRSWDLLAWVKSIVGKFLGWMEGPLSPAAACPNAYVGAQVQGLPDTAPISICITTGNPGHVTVTLFNRRHFALALTPAKHLQPPPLQLGPTGVVYLPSEGHVAFDLVADGRATSVAYRPDFAYTLISQFWPALLGGALGLGADGAAALLNGNDALECVHRQAPTNDNNAVSAATADCVLKKAQKTSKSPEKVSVLATIVKHLPFSVGAAMLANDSAGSATIVTIDRLPDVGATRRPTAVRTPSPVPVPVPVPSKSVRPTPQPTIDPHAPPATDPGQSPLPVTYTTLGGVNLESYCSTGWNYHAVLRYPNTWGWRCAPSATPHDGWLQGDQDVSVDDACANQYGAGARSHYRRYEDATSWFCWRA